MKNGAAQLHLDHPDADAVTGGERLVIDLLVDRRQEDLALPGFQRLQRSLQGRQLAPGLDGAVGTGSVVGQAEYGLDLDMAEH